MQAIQHANMYQPPLGMPCWHTVKDAAEATGYSESTIRRAIRRDCPDVARVSGPSVAGMIEIKSCGKTGYLPYHA